MLGMGKRNTTDEYFAANEAQETLNVSYDGIDEDFPLKIWVNPTAKYFQRTILNTEEDSKLEEKQELFLSREKVRSWHL